jgi:hypothetical protein
MPRQVRNAKSISLEEVKVKEPWSELKKNLWKNKRKRKFTLAIDPDHCKAKLAATHIRHVLMSS